MSHKQLVGNPVQLLIPRFVFWAVVSTVTVTVLVTTIGGRIALKERDARRRNVSGQGLAERINRINAVIGLDELNPDPEVGNSTTDSVAAALISGSTSAQVLAEED